MKIERMSPQKRKNLTAVLSRIVDANENSDDIESLEELIHNDSDARAYYLHYMAVHCELRKKEFAKNLEDNEAVQNKVIYKKMFFYAAAACLALMTFLWLQERSSLPSNLVADASVSAPYHVDKVYAVVSNAEAVQWSLEKVKPEAGTRLGAGKIKIFKGKLRLLFNQGEQFTIAAPAELEIIGAQKMRMNTGKLVAHIPKTGIGFTVVTPNGAVVDLGTDFAINVDNNGKNQVKVLKGAVVASSTDKHGHTVWVKQLNEGQEVSISKAIPLVSLSGSDSKYIQPLELQTSDLFLNEKQYTEAVIASKPMNYWKFNKHNESGEVLDEMGGLPLVLQQHAKIVKTSGGGRLEVGQQVENDVLEQGYAISKQQIEGLNTKDGYTIECWAYSNHFDWQTLVALTSKVSGTRQKYKVMHDPHLLLVERSGLTGSSHYHVHPNFSIRAVYRASPGFSGGANIYSTDSYLIHRWFHIAIVRKGEMYRVYIDGELSSELAVQDQHSSIPCNLIIGRMKAGKDSRDSRQWAGAIDEAALYNRALGSDEIKKHYRSGRSSL